MLDKKIFTGFMDWDSEDRAIDSTSYRYALNIQHYKFGVIESADGNTLASFSLPAGTNKTIGAFEDKLNSSIYYFVYNSNSSHSILEYNYEINLISQVMQSSLFNFNPNYLITGINIIDGLLYWTDDYNPPRKINISTAKNNQYPSPLIEEYIQAIKYPPLCQPTCYYQNDTNKNVNLLENKLFQFKYQYFFDDNEKSAWSPISALALPNAICSSIANPSQNNNIAINLNTGVGIIKRIRVAARIGNEGDFFLIADLDKSELSIPDNSTYIYQFYNDKIYTNLEVNESIKLYDDLPQLAKSQELLPGNRLAYGNVLNGYDNTPINTQASVVLADQPNLKTYSINGLIQITNIFSNNNQFKNYQPIHNNRGGGYCFGGYDKLSYTPNISSDYTQDIPLGGFVVYLAGTDYYGISRQRLINSLNQDSNNVIITNSNKEKNALQNFNGAIFSEYTIGGILPGTYILRIASHLTTQSDLNSSSRGYQNTSTYAYNVGGTNNTEVEVRIDNNGDVYINGILSTTTTVPTSYIMDLTDNVLLANSTAVSGYLTDADNTIISPTEAELLGDTRIEKSEITFQRSSGSFGGAFFNSLKNEPLIDKWQNGITYTDHNGFFFFTTRKGGSYDFNNIWVGATNSFNLTKYNYNPSSGTVSVYSSASSASMQGWIVRPSTTGQFDNERTLIDGQISTSNGVPLSNISISTKYGSLGFTDSYGQFNNVVYANTYQYGHVSQRSGRIYWNYSGECIATFNAPYDDFDFSFSATATGGATISPYSGTYNYTINVTVLPVVASVSGGIGSELSWARGGRYQLGVVYYDYANRSGTTNTNDGQYNVQDPNNNKWGMIVDIPYYNDIDPTTGAIYGKAKPSVFLSLYHQPPIWATHYQIVRSKNTATNRRLQWTAKQVDYVDDDRNLTSFSSATKIGLSIKSLIDYNTKYTDSVLKYSYAEGDRVRLIRDSNGNFFNQVYDVKIRDFDPAGILYIENPQGLSQLQAGLLFEVYTPKLEEDEQIYYEFGHCYLVGNPGTSQRYHMANSQNQNLAPARPAIVQMNEADTYYRLRNIPYSGGVKTWYIEDQMFSDFYKSKVENIGRPNKVDKDFKQIRRETTIYYSEIYVPETSINGLNSFFDLSFESYPKTYGSIQKLFTHDQYLDCYFELKTSQIPVDQVIFNDSTGQQVVGASPSILSSQPIYYLGEFGIGKNPESFSYFGSARYFVDLKRGAVMRLSNDGLTPISDIKFKTFFSEKSSDILSKTDRINIYGVYNRTNNEYVINFEEFTYQIGQADIQYPGITISFKEDANFWSTFYSYQPDFMCSKNVGIVTFKNGSLYYHDRNSTPNNYYGVQYYPEIWVISNMEPSVEKVFNGIWEETAEVWEPYSITTPRGQSTNLTSANFEKIKNMQFSPFLKDSNTPNIANPLFEGDDLFDKTCEIKLKYNNTNRTRLFAVDVQFIVNERTLK